MHLTLVSLCFWILAMTARLARDISMETKEHLILLPLSKWSMVHLESNIVFRDGMPDPMLFKGVVGGVCGWWLRVTKPQRLEV